jgi:hypothetical protein
MYRIPSGEKFACTTFAFFDGSIDSPRPTDLGDGYFLDRELPFQLSGGPRHLVGEFFAHQLETRPKVVMLVKMPSAAPNNIDEENKSLGSRVDNFLIGIAIAAGIPMYDFARGFTGGQVGEDIGGLQVRMVPRLIRSLGSEKPRIRIDHLRNAKAFAARFSAIEEAGRLDQGRYWRLRSGLRAFGAALQAPFGETKLHEFVRSLESLLPASVWGNAQFAEHVSYLVSEDGPRDAPTIELLKEIYQLRSAAEHHVHFAERLDPTTGEPVEARAQHRVRQIEALCREAYKRFLAQGSDQSELFQEERNLADFWANLRLVRDVWGPPFDINSVT